MNKNLDRLRRETDLAVFELIRRHGALASAVHCAFDLLELDGRDLRREPIEERKRLLGKLMRGSTFEEDGAICIPRGVQARLRGDRVEAAWLALPLGTLSALGESQKPKSAGSHARSGRRLELRPRHKAFLIPFLESRHGRPVHKIRRKDRLCGGFITRHCYVHDGQWRSDISIQHFRFTDHSWSYVSNGPICSKSNTIHGLPFRNSRLGLGRCNGRTSRRQKQGRSFGKTAKRNILRIRPRTVRSNPAARRYGKGGEDIAGSPFTLPALNRPPTISSLGNLLISPPSQRFCHKLWIEVPTPK